MSVNNLIVNFVQRFSTSHYVKAEDHTSRDILSWKKIENDKDYYGITAPLEHYMDVSKEDLLHQFWYLIEENDILIGRIISKSNAGLNVALICFDSNKSFLAEALKIIAFCPESNLPRSNNHDDPLSRFKDGDLVRGEVLLIDKKKGEIILSFHERSRTCNISFGCITSDDMPVSYKRTLSDESFNHMLCMSSGFYNPNVVDFLSKRLVSKPNKSFIVGLDNLTFSQKYHSDGLRKQQSYKIAKKCVKMGVDFFHNGQIIEALQELNRALDLDPSNIDALVARGAIYANKSAFLKSIIDFEYALKLDSDHKNAKKYLIEVLLDRAKSIEENLNDIQQIEEAENSYNKVLRLEPSCQEAKQGLENLQNSEPFKRLNQSSSSILISSDSSNDGRSATINKVKLLLQKDVGRHSKNSAVKIDDKKNHPSKRKSSKFKSPVTDSSSSCSSTSSSDTSDSDLSSSDASRHSHKKKKKRRKKDSKKLTRHKKSKSKASKAKSEKYSKQSKVSSSRRKSYPDESRRVDSKRRSLSYSKERDYSLSKRSWEDRKSESFTATERTQSNKLTTSTSKGNAGVITKIDKSTFGNILNQISIFEKDKTSKT